MRERVREMKSFINRGKEEEEEEEERGLRWNADVLVRSRHQYGKVEVRANAGPGRGKVSCSTGFWLFAGAYMCK